MNLNLEDRIATEDTQLTFYQCRTPNCPHFEIAKQIREFAATNKPCYAPAILCDGVDGCGKKWVRMEDTTLAEY
jgi:hypothetical protein